MGAESRWEDVKVLASDAWKVELRQATSSPARDPVRLSRDKAKIRGSGVQWRRTQNLASCLLLLRYINLTLWA